MNAIVLSIGPDSRALVGKAVAQIQGAEPEIVEAGDACLALERKGSHLIGCASDDTASLWFIGTFFADTPGWHGEGSPLDDPDRTASWLLSRYHESGRAFLDGAIGQFAVIVHDKAKDSWLASADPYGGRSFFTAEVGGAKVFATRLALAAAMMGETLAINREDEDFFLVHGFHPHGRTVFAGIRSLAAGEMLRVAGGRSESADPVRPAAFDHSTGGAMVDARQAAERLETLFLKALSSQLPSEPQKVGVLLGGFDSALVAAAIHRLGYPVVTYSFRYDQGSYNQPHTDTLAEHIGCEHRWIDIDRQMIEDGLERFPDLFSQPTNWPNYVIQTLNVVERMHEDGIDWCYSGDGCDAVFLGYPGTFARARLIGRLPRLPRPLHKALLGVFARPSFDRWLGHPWRVALGLLRATGRPEYARDYLSFRVMDDVSLRQLHPERPVADLEPEILSLSKPFEKLSGVRRTYQGKAAVSPNRSKMIASADATGVPILAPYMHPELKAWALALPLDMLRGKDDRQATGKTVLAEMAVQSGLLPPEIVHQPKMAAVDAPIDEWYDGPMRDLLLRYYEDLPFAADRSYLSRLLDVKRAETAFKTHVMTDKVISHAASLLTTYARFAALAKSDS